MSTEYSDTVVYLNEVGVSYDAKVTWALQGLNFVVRPGERWVILGANGSGKTTMVQLVTGYLHPSVGTLALIGSRLGSGVDWRVLRTRISVVSAAFAKLVRPELVALDVVMTAKHAALEPWWHEYTDEDRAKARMLLEAAGFGYLVDRRFGTMSEGERQQVQLARMLMNDPQLVVLDEPAAGLDLGARERFVARLADIANDTTLPAAILVTHHLEEIPPGFTHALLLRAGKVVASGPIADAITSKNVSETFDVRVQVAPEAGRFSARFV